jgi:hypothetical protein
MSEQGTTSKRSKLDKEQTYFENLSVTTTQEQTIFGIGVNYFVGTNQHRSKLESANLEYE